MNPSKEKIADWFRSLQNTICHSLEKADGSGTFREDLWKRPGGGGGSTRTMQNGSVIEKGGVNFSAVHGKLPDRIIEALQVKDNRFYATGLSIVLHPQNPMVPIIHMNTRYFELGNGTHWFGGGIDLTPHYIDREDAAYFHKELKNVCDTYDPEYYSLFKKWADTYFFIKHRNETRGIGGIFFDRLSTDKNHTLSQRFNFVKSVGTLFSPLYTQLMEKNRNIPYGEKEKQWQNIRRGRYVEFNLIYDKGTKFGLETEGRIESILMSLPQEAGWVYNYSPEKGSREEDTLSLLKKGIDWI